MKQIITGVHTLLDLIFREKDLSLSIMSQTRLTEGIAGHIEVQSSRPAHYEAEVPVQFSYMDEPYEVIVRGRIDGIYRYEDCLKIEEIKTTSMDLETLRAGIHPYYEAQLKLYMYFLKEQNKDKKIEGVLTYYSTKTGLTREFNIEFNEKDFRDFFEYLARTIIDIQKKEDEWKELRDNSIQELTFPFDILRKGQKELGEKISKIIEEGKNLLLEAPTGTGKTVAILFPSIKLLPPGLYEKIFFLTAKTPGQNIVRETLQIFKEKGLHMKSVFLNAKEKMCVTGDCNCDPLLCKYAEGYYEKLPSAIEEIVKDEIITREQIISVAETFKICPFEFSLDLSLYCDMVVCDYNYVFDPAVYLRRYFLGGKEKYLFLIDEAHNLVNRGRDMYSASLDKKTVLELKREMKHKDRNLYKFFDDMNKQFISWNKELKELKKSTLLLNDIPECFNLWKEEFFSMSDEFFGSNNQSLELKKFYYDFQHFKRIMELASEEHRIFIKSTHQNLFWKIFCLNPGKELSKRLKRSHASIFFSGTLSPDEYFRDHLGLKEETEYLSLPSPFPPENSLYLHIPGIATTYKRREEFYEKIAEHIKRVISTKKGNYLCFFPSYKFLDDVLARFPLPEDSYIFIQSKNMSETERDEFLKNFIPSGETRLGFVVMGGLFGEGIDLPGERLIGAIIIGVGLPMVDEEQSLISDYFEEKEKGKGFLYSYMIPGMIRVIQSAGRVYRTPADKGIVVLMDDRFRHSGYLKLMPKRWFTEKRALSSGEYEGILRDFWHGNYR
ncbi:MAG: helicase C-terminal domain-containing protein [Candidatus Eremiobacterota bacterium]